MAKVEDAQETAAESQSAPQADLVVGLPGLVDVAHVRSVAAQWSDVGRRITVVHPCVPGMSEALEKLGETGDVRLIAKEIAAVASSSASWLGQPPVYAALL